MSLEIVFVLVAAFGAGVVDAMAGGGGLIQLPALFAAFPTTPHPTLLGTGKLAGLAGTTSADRRASSGTSGSTGGWCCRPPPVRSSPRWSAPGSRPAFRPRNSARWCRSCWRACCSTRCCTRTSAACTSRAGRAGTGRALAAAGAGVIGLYDGFFGPGTGSFLVFLFVRVFGLDFLHASASAKIVNAAANLAAILLFGVTGEIFWLLGLAMAVCNVAGAQVGSHLAIRHGSGFVRNVFIAVVSCLIAKTAWDALHLAF